MTRQFSRWMRKTELTESALCLAVTEMSDGLIDADMGGGVLKKRVAMPGRGKSGSARTLLATNRASRWFSLSLGSRRTNAPMSPEKKLKHCSNWLPTFCDLASASSTSMSEAMH